MTFARGLLFLGVRINYYPSPIKDHEDLILLTELHRRKKQIIFPSSYLVQPGAIRVPKHGNYKLYGQIDPHIM